MSYPDPASNFTKIFWIVIATATSIFMAVYCIKAFSNGEYFEIIKPALFGTSIWTVPLYYLHRRTNQDGRTPTKPRLLPTKKQALNPMLCFGALLSFLILVSVTIYFYWTEKHPYSAIGVISCIAIPGAFLWKLGDLEQGPAQ